MSFEIRLIELRNESTWNVDSSFDGEIFLDSFKTTITKFASQRPSGEVKKIN
jgi:hypothetical protein